MKFYLKHNVEQKCWLIYDMQNKKNEAPFVVVSIGDELMDRLLAGYLVMQGAVETKKINWNKLSGEKK